MIMISGLQSHWGFTKMPFGRDLPADNLFRGNAHKEAVARLRYLIDARGLGVLTGEVGSGKTVAVRAATHGLDTSRHNVIYLANPMVGTRGYLELFSRSRL
jgi:type II secretory pathway predicted ATPase ExeA